MRRLGLAGDEVPSSLEGFIDRHLSPDRQLTLRLARPNQNHRETKAVTGVENGDGFQVLDPERIGQPEDGGHHHL